LLFENIKGHPGHRALYNTIGCNLSRFCLMIGEEPVDHPLKAVQALQRKMGRTIKAAEVPAETAICNQNIDVGDAIDIRKFPAQRMWPLDGGLYLGTGDAVVTQCPETGRVNVGTLIPSPRSRATRSATSARTRAATASPSSQMAGISGGSDVRR
jgi:4-hydroxy-3-polyprenylbenzoate decarboxylase